MCDDGRFTKQQHRYEIFSALRLSQAATMGGSFLPKHSTTIANHTCYFIPQPVEFLMQYRKKEGATSRFRANARFKKLYIYTLFQRNVHVYLV